MCVPRDGGLCARVALEQAKILVAEAEENNLTTRCSMRGGKGGTCSLCEQKIGVGCVRWHAERRTSGGRRRACSAVCDDYLGTVYPRQITTRMHCLCKRPSCLYCGALALMKYDLSSRSKILWAAIDHLGDLMTAYAVNVYSGTLELYGEQDKDTPVAANNYAVSLNGLRRWRSQVAVAENNARGATHAWRRRYTHAQDEEKLRDGALPGFPRLARRFRGGRGDDGGDGTDREAHPRWRA